MFLVIIRLRLLKHTSYLFDVYGFEKGGRDKLGLKDWTRAKKQ